MSVVKDHPVGSLGALDAVYEVGVEDADEFAIAINGTWVGTITFQVSLDGTNWYNIALHDSNQADKKQASITTTANGLFFHESAAFMRLRCKMTAYTSGTATVKFVTTRMGV